MNIKRLKYFLALAEQKHFGRAARILHISQPPLSQQIRLLEEELGMTLFARTTRHVELTEAGLVLFQRLKSVMHDLEHAISYAQLVHRGEGGTFRSGFVSTSADFLASILRLFRRRYPDTNVECLHMTSQEQAVALQNRKIDVGLVRSVPADHNVGWRVIRREPLFVALPARHPLNRFRSIDPSALANEPFVMWDPRQSGGMALAATTLCRKHGFNPRIAFEVVNSQALLSLVADGLGVAIVPEPALRMKQAGLVYKPLRGASAYADLMLVWRRDNMSELSSRFIAAIAELSEPGLPGSRSSN